MVKGFARVELSHLSMTVLMLSLPSDIQDVIKDVV